MQLKSQLEGTEILVRGNLNNSNTDLKSVVVRDNLNQSETELKSLVVAATQINHQITRSAPIRAALRLASSPRR